MIKVIENIEVFDENNNVISRFTKKYMTKNLSLIDRFDEILDECCDHPKLKDGE